MTALAIVVQPIDTDGDGLPASRDNCPTAAGTLDNQGCPLTIPIADSDGDGIPDTRDTCPNLAGILENNGCPIPPSSTVPALVLPPLPTDGRCVLATIDADPVNIRETASTDAAIVARLNPTETANALATTTTAEGIWYQIEGGWVAGWVTRLGGDCSTVLDANANPDNFTAEIPFEDSGLLVPAVQNIPFEVNLQDCPALLPQVDALPTFLTLYIVGEPDPCAAAQAELDGCS